MNKKYTQIAMVAAVVCLGVMILVEKIPQLRKLVKGS